MNDETRPLVYRNSRIIATNRPAATRTHPSLGVVCVAKPHTLLLMLLLSNKVGNELPTLRARAGVVDYFEILARVGCRGLPLLVVGGETPALAKDWRCFNAA